MRLVFLSCFAAFALAGCVTSSGNFCDIAKPIRLTPATIQALTDQEARDALAHNEKLQALCGVRP